MTLENERENNKTKSVKNNKSQNIQYPLKIRANHKGQEYHAELLSIEGLIAYDNQEYPTPTQAAKTITNTSVNGWDFWRYKNLESDKWVKIGKLRNN